MRTMLLTQLAIAGYFTGIIWLVQTVVYPLMLKIPQAEFGAYHSRYTRTMGWVVGPLMLVELILAFATLCLFYQHGPLWIQITALGCTALCWLSTSAVQVPLHTYLSERWDAEAIRQLVSTNWIRTVAWSVRLLLLSIWFLFWEVSTL